MVGICCCSCMLHCYCITDCQFPGNKSCAGKPGKKFENRIKYNYDQKLFKTNLESFVKNKTYSVLNIVGLSVGLTCFALIALWVNDELSYDKFNSNYDRIVRLTGIEKRKRVFLNPQYQVRQWQKH